MVAPCAGGSVRDWLGQPGRRLRARIHAVYMRAPKIPQCAGAKGDTCMVTDSAGDARHYAGLSGLGCGKRARERWEQPLGEVCYAWQERGPD